VWCGDGILKFLYLHHVPILFPSVFNDVLRFSRGFLRKFLKFSMCSPTVFPIAPHFNPYPVPKVLLFSPTYLTKRGATLTSHTNSIEVYFCVIDQLNRPWPGKKNKPTELGR
jgi:hypothetical protein